MTRPGNSRVTRFRQGRLDDPVLAVGFTGCGVDHCRADRASCVERGGGDGVDGRGRHAGGDVPGDADGVEVHPGAELAGEAVV